MEAQHDNLSAQELQVLHVGLLLFGRDWEAIQELLMPQHQVQDIARFYCSSYAYSRAAAYNAALQAAGFQPGALVSANMRTKLLQDLSSACRRDLHSDCTITASFKAFDECRLPLIKLVAALVQVAGPAAFACAVLDALPTCGLCTENLTLSETAVTWDDAMAKLREHPGLFDACLWPVLAAAGWAKSGQQQQPEQPQQQDGPTSTPAVPPVFTPPPGVAAAYEASTGAQVRPCLSTQDVLAVLSHARAALPEGCASWMRGAELQASVDACLAASGLPSAPHRQTGDPSGQQQRGIPYSRRKHMCANCGVGTTSVWRFNGNARLTLCNACGTYMQTNNTHRPEHLVAKARARTEGAATAGLPDLPTAASPGPKGGADQRGGVATPDSDIADDCSGAGSGSEEGDSPAASKRPRTRRRTQINKRLTSEYVMLDSHLSEQQPDVLPPEGSDGWAGLHSQRQRPATASPHARRAQGGGAPARDCCSAGLGFLHQETAQELHRPTAGTNGGSDADEEDDHLADHLEPPRRASPRTPRQRDGGNGDATQEVEDLLQRILIHSPIPSDASDACAADALVTMARSPLSCHEQQHLAQAMLEGKRSPQPVAAVRGNGALGGGSGSGGRPSAACRDLFPATTAAGGGAMAPSGQQLLDVLPPQPRSQQDAQANKRLSVALMLAAAGFAAAATGEQPHEAADGGDVGDAGGGGGTGRFGSMGVDVGGADDEGGAGVQEPDKGGWQQSALGCADTFGSRHAGVPALHQSAPGGLSAARGTSCSSHASNGACNDRVPFPQHGWQHAAYDGPGEACGSGGGGGGRDGTRAGAGSSSRALSRFGTEHMQQQMDRLCPHPASNSPASPRRQHQPTPSSPASRPQRRAAGRPGVRSCANCGCKDTCQWRRDKADRSRLLCNACGNYKVANGRDRPTDGMHRCVRNVIMRRPPGLHPRSSRAVQEATGCDDEFVDGLPDEQQQQQQHHHQQNDHQTPGPPDTVPQQAKAAQAGSSGSTAEEMAAALVAALHCVSSSAAANCTMTAAAAGVEFALNAAAAATGAAAAQPQQQAAVAGGNPHAQLVEGEQDEQQRAEVEPAEEEPAVRANMPAGSAEPLSRNGSSTVAPAALPSQHADAAQHETGDEDQARAVWRRGSQGPSRLGSSASSQLFFEATSAWLVSTSQAAGPQQPSPAAAAAPPGGSSFGGAVDMSQAVLRPAAAWQQPASLPPPPPPPQRHQQQQQQHATPAARALYAGLQQKQRPQPGLGPQHQQLPLHVAPPADAAAAHAGQAALVQRLLPLWMTAQATQVPADDPATTFTVLPDGSCTRGNNVHVPDASALLRRVSSSSSRSCGGGSSNMMNAAAARPLAATTGMGSNGKLWGVPAARAGTSNVPAAAARRLK